MNRALKEILVEIDGESRKVGLVINEMKIKYMVVSAPEVKRTNSGMSFRDTTFEAVQHFTNVGAEINSETKVAEEKDNDRK